MMDVPVRNEALWLRGADPLHDQAQHSVRGGLKQLRVEIRSLDRLRLRVLPGWIRIPSIALGN